MNNQFVSFDLHLGVGFHFCQRRTLLRLGIAYALLILFIGRSNAFQRASGELKLLSLEINDSNFIPDLISGGNFQYFEGSIYYLKPNTQMIKIFDFQSGSEISEIGLFGFGKNSVGKEVETFHVLQEDSILVYSEFNKNLMSLINSKGEVSKNYRLRGSRADALNNMPVSLVSGIGAIARLGSKILTSHYSRDYDHSKVYPTLQSTCLDSGSSNFVMSAPKIYENKLMRVPRLSPLLSSFIVVNSFTGEIVIGSPLDHDLYVSKDSLKSFESVISQSSYIDKFRLLNQDITDINANEYESQMREVSLISPKYHALLYNPYKKQYYRIASLGYSEEEIQARRNGESVYITPKVYSVMVLDHSLKTIKEKRFSSEEFHFHRGMFVAPDGLWVLSKFNTDRQYIGFLRLDLGDN